MRILIIEDDLIIRMFFEKVITNMGLQVIGTANNGDDGLVLIDKHLPDLVLTILELHLPDLFLS